MYVCVVAAIATPPLCATASTRSRRPYVRSWLFLCFRLGCSVNRVHVERPQYQPTTTTLKTIIFFLLLLHFFMQLDGLNCCCRCGSFFFSCLSCNSRGLSNIIIVITVNICSSANTSYYPIHIQVVRDIHVAVRSTRNRKIVLVFGFSFDSLFYMYFAFGDDRIR